MRVNPESDIAVLLLQPGEYDFEVLGAEEKISNSGNDMFILKLRVGPKGNTRFLTDYVVRKNTKKLFGACKACGLVAQYFHGEIVAGEFIGKVGRVLIGIDKGKGEYLDRNNVVRYLPPAKG